MSKLDKYMQGRTEGMEFALRIVKDNCKKAMKVLDMIQESYVLYNTARAGLTEYTVFQMPQDEEIKI